MAFDYSGTAQDVFAELQEAGALASITWTPPAAPGDDYDPATGSGTDPDPVTITTYGAIFDYNSHKFGQGASGNQDNAMIKVGDRQLYLAAIGTDGNALAEPPEEATVVGPDGAAYVLVTCKALGPAGVNVLFDIQVRRP